MRFIHTADWHIGCLSNHIGIEKALDRTKHAINNIIKLCKDYEVDCLFVAGDIFHRANITREEISLFFDILLKLEKCPFKTYFISGNHDKISNEITTLHNFSKLSRSCILKNIKFIIDSPEIIKICDNNVLFVPFINTVETFLKLESYDADVVVAHYPIIGSKISNNRPIEKGMQLPEISKIKYIAFGDIHQYQKLAKGIYYSGVPYQTKSDENEDCYVNIVEIINEKTKIKKLQIEKYWPIYHLYASSSDDISNIPNDAYVILHLLSPIDISKVPQNVILITGDAKETNEHKVDVNSMVIDPLEGMKNQIIAECSDMILKSGIEFTNESLEEFYNDVLAEAESIISKTA